MKKPKDTSWGTVAEWYSTYLETNPDSYQRQVILPNLLRILAIRQGMRVLDVACGQGFFARAFEGAGASVVGVDIASDLITEAKKLSKNIPYHVTPADALGYAEDGSFDAVTMVLAIQNIENMTGAFAEASRVLHREGRLVLVMMHPAFRIPERSSWGWDGEGGPVRGGASNGAGVQYRRVDGYLSAARSTLLVHPGQKDSPTTTSYHRSLQDFSKALFKTGFTITRLEEWISHKQSEKGPRQSAENLARKEIPMFLMLEATKR
ncbi:class I SAM-dependent methyltransferase [Candidatus Kaiserbacteria bacterium]|nr:class I SAM-dependent methyltransferase [Candidatus Kaiserbacteria bacterium]